VRVVSVVVIASMLVACGSANVNVLKRYRGTRLPAPRGIVVYPFELTGESVGLGEETHEDKPVEAALTAEETFQRREVAKVMSEYLVRELENRGLPATMGSGELEVPDGSMAIGGQIVTVDPGSAMGRVFIGFGYGRSRISSVARLEGQVDGVGETLLEFQNTAKSGPKPGILTTLPIGFMVQGITVLAVLISGGLAGIGELNASLGADAKRTADELADAIEKSLGKVARSY
jgi:hypothetical protein